MQKLVVFHVTEPLQWWEILWGLVILTQVCCKTLLCRVNSNFEQLWDDPLRSVNCSHRQDGRSCCCWYIYSFSCIAWAIPQGVQLGTAAIVVVTRTDTLCYPQKATFPYKSQVFWHVMLCWLVNRHRHLEVLWYFHCSAWPWHCNLLKHR